MHRTRRFKAGGLERVNPPVFKSQPLTAQLLRDLRAVFDHFLFHVEAHDGDRAIADRRQQVMQSEREVTLAATEIDDVQRPFGGQVLQDVIDEFEVAVDLPELVIHRRSNLAVRKHHADFRQERARLTDRDQVVLFAVVFHHRLGRERRRRSFDFERSARLFPEREVSFEREEVRVAKRLSERGLRSQSQLVGGEILVRLLRPRASGPLIGGLTIQLDRSHCYLEDVPFRGLQRLAQDEALKRITVQRLSEQRNE